MKIASALLLTSCLFLSGTAGATDPSDFDLLKAMSAADVRASGLGQLTDAQLNSLSAWFAQYQHDHPAPCAAQAAVAPAAVAPAAAASAAKAPATDADGFPIHATLVGDFRGWNGATTFTLDNGEVWEQVDDDSFSTGSIHDPKVTISKGWTHSSVLSVEGVKETVMVKRVKP